MVNELVALGELSEWGSRAVPLDSAPSFDAFACCRSNLRMGAPTYREAVKPSDAMPVFTVGEVVCSTAPNFKPGEIVEGMNGWQEYAADRLFRLV